MPAAILRICSMALLWTCATVSMSLMMMAQAAESAGLGQLQGSWTVSAAEQSGKPLDLIKGGVLKIAGDAFVLRTAAGNEFNGKLRLNPDVSPKQLDFLLSTGATWEGIYSVNSNLLRLNYVEAGDGNPRPSLFATTADTPGTVIVMRKASE